MADGAFDAATRAAIRAFQRDRDLEPTGYLTQTTDARMPADLGGVFGRHPPRCGRRGGWTRDAARMGNRPRSEDRAA